MKNNPLGIFDSGVGGLTVLKKMMEVLPHEDTIYFADTARLPYGDKSPQTIVRCSLQNADFLSQHNIKLLVVACNTASAYSALHLRERFNIPIIDVIEPAIESALKLTQTKKIAVLGTRATINSRIYETQIKQRLHEAEVTSIACPLFVPLVEENFLSHPAAKLIITEYLAPILNTSIDVVILGCTHYPRLQPLIQEVLGDHVTIIDSATACAHKILEELDKKQLRKTNTTQSLRKYFASDDAEKFKRLGEHFLGTCMGTVEHYSFDL